MIKSISGFNWSILIIMPFEDSQVNESASDNSFKINNNKQKTEKGVHEGRQLLQL